MRKLWRRLFIRIKDSFFKEENDICSTCKTGEYYFKLDKSELFCPMIECHRGSYCSAYEPLCNNKACSGKSKVYIKPEVIIYEFNELENYQNILNFQSIKR